MSDESVDADGKEKTILGWSDDDVDDYNSARTVFPALAKGLVHIYPEVWRSEEGEEFELRHALYRHRRRHIHCAGMGVPVPKMTVSETRSFWVPARPYPRNEHAVGDAEIEPI